MLFGQLSNRDSLSDANEHRDWRIFAEYAYILIAEARKVCSSNDDFDLKVDGNIYAVDSTTIDLCLSVFWWAKFRKNKAAVKIHTQFDVKTDIPSFIYITDGSVHDVNFMDIIDFMISTHINIFK